jgi:hypothetical protein
MELTCCPKLRALPATVRPEPVEGLLAVLCPGKREGFDKLSPNGEEEL